MKFITAEEARKQTDDAIKKEISFRTSKIMDVIAENCEFGMRIANYVFRRDRLDLPTYNIVKDAVMINLDKLGYKVKFDKHTNTYIIEW